MEDLPSRTLILKVLSSNTCITQTNTTKAWLGESYIRINLELVGIHSILGTHIITLGFYLGQLQWAPSNSVHTVHQEPALCYATRIIEYTGDGSHLLNSSHLPHCSVGGASGDTAIMRRLYLLRDSWLWFCRDYL